MTSRIKERRTRGVPHEELPPIERKLNRSRFGTNCLTAPAKNTEDESDKIRRSKDSRTEAR